MPGESIEQPPRSRAPRAGVGAGVAGDGKTGGSLCGQQRGGLQRRVCDLSVCLLLRLTLRVCLSLPTARAPAAAAAPRLQMPTLSTATRAPGETAKWARPRAAPRRQDPCPPPRSLARPHGPSPSPWAAELPPSWGLTPLSRPTTAARHPFSSPLTPRNALLRLEPSTPFPGLPTPQALRRAPLRGPRPPRLPWLPPAPRIPQAPALQARPMRLPPPPPAPPPPRLPPSGRSRPWSPLTPSSWGRVVLQSLSCCAVRSPGLWGCLGLDPAFHLLDPPRPSSLKV